MYLYIIYQEDVRYSLVNVQTKPLDVDLKFWRHITLMGLTSQNVSKNKRFSRNSNSKGVKWRLKFEYRFGYVNCNGW